MASKLDKRLSTLMDSSDSGQYEGPGVFKITFLTFLSLSIFGFLFSSKPEISQKELREIYVQSGYDEPLEEDEILEATWYDYEIKRAENRSNAMNYTVIGLIFSGLYESIAENLIDLSASFESEDEEFSLNTVFTWIAQTASGSFLRFLFPILTFWPFWLVAFWFSYVIAKKSLQHKTSSSVLGFCDLEGRPFYSGIYGPLNPNNSISGIDHSCPNLACPAQEKESIAEAHQLVKLLKKYRAFNQTNFDLVRVILAHKDYPAEVLEERSAEEEDAEEMGAFITNENGTIEESALEGLKAILESHLILARLHKENKKVSPRGISYKDTSDKLKELIEPLSPLGKILTTCLIPARGKAIASVPPTLVATSFLAIEAGKSLVYDRRNNQFTRISIYPHLQARAVLQSLLSYHSDYKGDGRLIARQAIICSRRHGDFGRAFLPINMPIQSRAIRDWLEILYYNKDKRESMARLCELDAFIEELHLGFKENLSQFVTDSSPEKEAGLFKKGQVHKSVILMPLNNLLDFVFSNVEKAKLSRISELMEITRELQQSLSISARLPGFKRQAIEAAKCKNTAGEIVAELQAQKGGGKLVERWFIARRMLTRYNWLSTRVGDYTVPQDGLIQSILIDRSNQQKPEIFGLDAVTPLRQRRFQELFGEDWEKDYYASNIHPRDIGIFVETKNFKQELSKKMNQAASGHVDGFSGRRAQAA